MQWIPRSDVRHRGKHLVHVHAEGGTTTEHRVVLREIALEEFAHEPTGEPIRLRAAVCERCGAILAVLAVTLR